MISPSLTVEIFDLPPFASEFERFYVFLESFDRLRSTAVTGPSGSALSLPSPFDIPSVRRLRFSAVRADHFDESQGRFVSLPRTGASFEQRRERRAQLNAVFGEQTMPLIDVYLRRSRAGLNGGSIRPSSWREMVVGPVSRSPGAQLFGALAVIGDPDREDEDRLAEIFGLRRVRPETLERLTDIFSLAHVADLGEDDGPEGEREPEPNPPLPIPGEGVCVLRVKANRDREPEPAWVRGGIVLDELEPSPQPTPQRQMIRL